MAKLKPNQATCTDHGKIDCNVYTNKRGVVEKVGCNNFNNKGSCTVGGMCTFLHKNYIDFDQLGLTQKIPNRLFKIK